MIYRLELNGKQLGQETFGSWIEAAKRINELMTQSQRRFRAALRTGNAHTINTLTNLQRSLRENLTIGEYTKEEFMALKKKEAVVEIKEKSQQKTYSATAELYKSLSSVQRKYRDI